jgi:glyoxylase-like metal-dependent hydrolase (beta-lactamase superfamily II)
LTVDDIDIVMCTHLHVDHVGWNTRLENGRWVLSFPRVPATCSLNRNLPIGQNRTRRPVLPFAASVLPIVEANQHELVSGADTFDDHIRLMPTPGHTPDHFAVVIGRGRDEGVFMGDLRHTPLKARYPEISMRADVDPAQAAVTRRAFLERYCDASTVCCTAHFPSPSTLRVKQWGDGFRCDSVSD